MPESSSSADDDIIPVVNFRPILSGVPGGNNNLYRSSAPESAANRIATASDYSSSPLNEAEHFILNEADMILDLRPIKEGDVSLKTKLAETAPGGAFEVKDNEIPETFEVGKRYLIRVDFIGDFSKTFNSFIDNNWLAPNELYGLDENAVFQKRRSSFNSRGLAGLNQVLLERKESMNVVLKLFTNYLERVPGAKILVHCTAGKDTGRTGMVCMLLQFVAGFADEDISREYVTSESEAKLVTVRAMKKHKVTLADPEIFSGATKEGIDGALSHLRVKYGSIENYLDEIGFDSTWRERLKRVLLKQ